MNARPLPMTSSPIADVASLECEIPYAAAITAGMSLIRAMQLEVEDIPLAERGIHLHLTRLATASRIGHDIETCGSGQTSPQAIRSGLYPAIAHLLHADYAHCLETVSLPVADYLKLPEVNQAFPDLMPVMAEQTRRTLATIEFKQLSGSRALSVPLALVNPAYLQDIENGNAPDKIKDDFDYSVLRKYSSNIGIAAGATRDEALLQGMLSVQEQIAAGRFAVQGIALRQRRYLRQVDVATLPPQIAQLREIVTTRCSQFVHLFDITGNGSVPTYLACVEGAMEGEWEVAAGAGFTPEHAATRALRNLLQFHELCEWKRNEHGEDMQEANRLRQRGLLTEHQGQYRHFALQNLQQILRGGAVDTVPFATSSVGIPETLAGRIEQLQAHFKQHGLTLWFAQYQKPGIKKEVTCVQVLLAPFDASFLLLQGVPVGISVASLEHAANEE